MDVKKLTTRLEQMKGKTFTYANQVHCVLDIRTDDEKFVVKTNLSEFSRKHEAADEFLKYWAPATQGSIAVLDEQQQISLYVEQGRSQADDLIAILKGNITKVQENPGYIPQAQTVNDQVKSIIDIEKMKLDYLKQLRGK
jgi:hypothetical protein